MSLIIFLDFDGVLHPDSVYRPRNKPLALHGLGELFMHAHILEEALNSYPEAKIILSTSWVRTLGYQRTLKKMPQKLKDRVIGSTWHKEMRQDSYDPFDWLSRYEQIEWHVKRNGVNKWLAIDDLHSGTEDWPVEHLSRLVLTEESKGLGCQVAQADLKAKLMEMGL